MLKHYRSLISIAVCVFTILSCQNETQNLLPIPIHKVTFSDSEIEDAYEWFQSNFSKSNARVSKDGDKVDPDWKEAINDGYTIEMPLLYNGKSRGSLLKTQENKPDFQKKKSDEVEGITRILMKKGRKGKGYDMIVIKIVPDQSYAASNKNLFKAKKIKLGTLRENKFSGIVIYENIDGEFLSGLKMQDGKWTCDLEYGGKLGQYGGRPNNIISVCESHYVAVYERDCYPSTGQCGEWELVSTIFLYRTCYDIEVNGGSAGGSGYQDYFVDQSGKRIQIVGQVDRNTNKVFDIIQKFFSCPIRDNITIHLDFQPSQLTIDAGIFGYQDGNILRVGGSAIGAAYAAASDNIHIWLSENAFAHGELYLAMVLGHELVHAQHLKDNYNLFINNGNQFVQYSEYSAYQFSIDFFQRYIDIVKGDPFLKQINNQLVTKRNSYTFNTSYGSNLCF